MSCIDHVYTNYKYRCSKVRVIPFGNSDHDVIQYVRYAKDPPQPLCVIRKRSYKNFVLEEFINHLENVSWAPVYSCTDVDHAVNSFTSIFNEVLDQHAPWIVYQQRRNFTPWVTPDTIKLMKERDKAKADAS